MQLQDYLSEPEFVLSEIRRHNVCDSGLCVMEMSPFEDLCASLT